VVRTIRTSLLRRRSPAHFFVPRVPVRLAATNSIESTEDLKPPSGCLAARTPRGGCLEGG
jgi:hypothetical protein